MTASSVPSFARYTSQIQSNNCFIHGFSIWSVGGSGAAQSVAFPGRSAWTTYDTESTITFRAGVSSGSAIVLVGAGDDAVYSSDDGATWSPSTLPTGRSWADIIMIGAELDYWITVDSTAFGTNCAAYASSTTGNPPTSWSEGALSNTVAWASLAHQTFGICAVGAQSYSFSFNWGVTWTAPATFTGVTSNAVKVLSASYGYFVLFAEHYALGLKVIVDFDVADEASLPGGAFDGQLYRTLDNNHGWVSDGSDNWTDIGVIIDGGAPTDQLVWRTFAGPIIAGEQDSVAGYLSSNTYLVTSAANDAIAYLLNFQGGATNTTTLNNISAFANDFAYNLTTDTFWQYDGAAWNNVGLTLSNIWGLGGLAFPFTTASSLGYSDNEWDLGLFIMGLNSVNYYRSQDLLINGASPVLPWTL